MGTWVCKCSLQITKYVCLSWFCVTENGVDGVGIQYHLVFGRESCLARSKLEDSSKSMASQDAVKCGEGVAIYQNGANPLEKNVLFHNQSPCHYPYFKYSHLKPECCSGNNVSGSWRGKSKQIDFIISGLHFMLHHFIILFIMHPY